MAGQGEDGGLFEVAGGREGGRGRDTRAIYRVPTLRVSSDGDSEVCFARNTAVRLMTFAQAQSTRGGRLAL